MEELRATVQRLHALREETGLTRREMADSAGISEAEYELLESGKTDVSFTVLFRCANRLGVDISAIVTGDDPKLRGFTLCRKGDGMPIKRREGFDYLHMAYLLKDRLAEPFMVTAKYSKQLEDSPIHLATHTGQEFDFVVEGSLRVQIDDHIETLNAGDSVYYDSAHPHGMVAAGGQDCRFIAVVIKGGAPEDDYSEYGAVAKQTPDRAVRAPKTGPDDRVYKRYVNETIDEKGMLKNISFNIPEDFNFAYDVVDEIAKKKPNKLAMQWVSHTGEERRFSFSDMSRLSSKTANLFRAQGIKKGDKVLLVLRRNWQFWSCILALHKIGAVAVTATDQLMPKDFVYRFNAAGVKAVVCTGFGRVSDMITEALPQSPTVEKLFVAGGPKEGFIDLDAEVEKQSDSFKRVRNDVFDAMLMYFTSGTTGYPKIAVHDFSYPLGHIVTAKWWQNVNEDGLHFSVADTGWGKAAWGKIYGQWLCEAAVFTMDFDRFNPVDILPMFAKYHITTFCAPPTIFRFFIKEDLKKYDLSSVEYACIAGEALNSEVFNRFYEATGVKLMEGFGQTESTVIVGNLWGMEPKPGSMGKPSPEYKVLVADADAKPVQPGETGEILVDLRGGAPVGLFKEYYRDADNTNEVRHDGFYHTRDMAWQDEDGYLWYVGRADDVIKSSGYRIGPFEIESVLMEMAEVLECAVTGAPDEIRGQLVKATVVLAPGFEGSDELKKRMQTYVKEHTAPYKYPRAVEFVSTLPKTISGKIRRKDIQ